VTRLQNQNALERLVLLLHTR